jgi:uncharacterized protein with ACT and thioredoxin-like domain
MALQRLTVNRIAIEDRPGALQEVLSAAAESDSNILHLAAFSVGAGKGETYLVPDKPEALQKYAGSKGMELEEYTGFLLSGMDKSGVGAEVTKRIADAGVNIVLSSANVVGGDYYLLIVVEQKDADATAQALEA